MIISFCRFRSFTVFHRFSFGCLRCCFLFLCFFFIIFYCILHRYVLSSVLLRWQMHTMVAPETLVSFFSLLLNGNAFPRSTSCNLSVLTNGVSQFFQWNAQTLGISYKVLKHLLYHSFSCCRLYHPVNYISSHFTLHTRSTITLLSLICVRLIRWVPLHVVTLFIHQVE